MLRLFIPFMLIVLLLPIGCMQDERKVISISPAGAMVPLGGAQSFYVTSRDVTWSVAPGSFGTIDPDGAYTAPVVMPSNSTVVVHAVSVSNPARVATAR